ncbi:MAG TPA: lipid-binding SYLF domain-containing protein [Steroidobacteraceae bacterium]|jgi:lipid-binding SYLF domain-containing protein|nr:lipid-binding SYLF domain-containing protein [Steroidobacteraceae bacterium]
MTRSNFLLAILCTVTLAAPWQGALAQSGEPSREEATLITATQVLEELAATPDQRVPDWLMQRAYGVAVVPEVIKGAFFFGGRYGNGVLSVRDASSGRFSNPIFIRLGGGSFGAQIGATSTDVVLVFVTPRSVENFARGKFTLGADVSVAAGPVGRQTEAAAGKAAEIYSYSRSRGLFAGVALDGTVIAFDRSGNRAFYNDDDVTTSMITRNKVTTHSESARRFVAAVAGGANADASTAPGPTPAAAAPPPAAAPPAPANSGDVHTFPMEDSHPGGEPH